MHVPGARRRVRGQGDERCTPPTIWRPMLHALGLEQFDLDPATNSFSTVPARTRWTRREDGLAQPWFGHIWVNFPFSSSGLWVSKIRQSLALSAVKTITVLSPGDTGNTWWPELWSIATAWAAWPQREHFPLPGEAKGQPAGAPHLWLCVGPQEGGALRQIQTQWVTRLRAHGVPCERRTG